MSNNQSKHQTTETGSYRLQRLKLNTDYKTTRLILLKEVKHKSDKEKTTEKLHSRF